MLIFFFSNKKTNGAIAKKPIKNQKELEEEQVTYSQIFGEWLCYKAEQDDLLTAITPAMREGSGLVEFSRKYPDRYYDVAIAEQHSVSLQSFSSLGSGFGN